MVQSARARVKSTSSLPQPVVAQHFVLPPPASVPSSRRSTSSSLSSTSPISASVETLMPACPTGWARFDLSPLNEVTQDASSSTVSQITPRELTAETASDAQPTADDQQADNFAKFPSSSVSDEKDVEQPPVAESHMPNDKFSDSFLALSFDDGAKQDASVVTSSSFELMSPSSDKDSISLPSPEVPPPPLPDNVVTAELPSEPPVPPPRPRPAANSQVGQSDELSAGPVTPSSARSDSVHSSPGLPLVSVPALAGEIPATKPQTTVANTSAVSDRSQHITISDPKSRFTVQPSSAGSSVLDAGLFPLTFPSDDAPPPPLPPRHVPVSSDAHRQQLLRGISLPASGKIHSVDDVPPPPPPRRSLSKPANVDPFAPIPVSVPVSSVPAKQQTAVPVTLPFSSGSSVVETTIAPLPRPRPHVRQTQVITSEAVSGSVAATSSDSSSPWQSVSTPPVIEPVPVDPFSNVDPFAGSVSPDDPFAEPSLDGMLSDLCHDFESDTLSMTAFRTRAVTVDSVSSDVYDAGASSSVLHHEESRSSSHCNVADVAQAEATLNTEAAGTGCLVDLNTADDACSISQATSGLAAYGDLQDVWYSTGAVNWKPASCDSLPSSDITTSLFDSSVSSVPVQQLDTVSAQVSDIQPVVSILDTSSFDMPAGVSVDSSLSCQVVTSANSLQSHIGTLSSCTADQRSITGNNDIASHSLRAMSEPPGLSQVVSSIGHRNSSFGAVFGQFDDCFMSTQAANGTSVVSSADATEINATCSNQLITTSLNKSDNSADLPASDVQVIH